MRFYSSSFTLYLSLCIRFVSPVWQSQLHRLYRVLICIKLEIWGRAQREAARRRKSDWGTVKRLKFRSQQNHVTRTQLHYHIQGGPKKLAQCFYMSITLSHTNRFSKFFYCWNQEKICGNTIIIGLPYL